MSEKPDAETGEPKEEPFLLSMLPFAGLLLLLGCALLWHFVSPAAPGSGSRSSQGPTDGPGPAELAVDRWERANTRTIPVEPGDFTRGPEDAPVTIVEFTDFQCPYCRAGWSEVDKTLTQYGDKVRLVFKNFPLDKTCNDTMTQQLHPFACRAAIVARCVGEKDDSLFWKAHDLLFTVSDLSDEVLERIPAELSLKPKDIQACLSSDETVARIQRDIRQAQELGVTATPSFFLNGRPVADYRDGSLSRLVEHVLGEASSGDSGGS
jgi:protein-disulfide isomerase